MSNPNETPGDGLTLPEKVLEHVKVSSIALEKAAAAEEARQTKQAEVDAIIPGVCDTLVEHERIRPEQRDKLAEALKDPAEVLNILIKVANHKNSAEQGKLGAGVDPNGTTKTAGARGYNSLTDPFVGQRTTRVKESDAKLFAGLGVAPPQG